MIFDAVQLIDSGKLLGVFREFMKAIFWMSGRVPGPSLTIKMHSFGSSGKRFPGLSS